MLQININKDENLQDACNIFISALLPHDRYNATYYTEILQTLFRYVRLEEFSGQYYILLKILTELKDLKSRFEDFSPVLTEESLSNTLEVSIADSITNPVVGMKEILEREGLPSNLEIETVKENACHKLYAMTMELYETCFSLEQESETALNHVPMLRSAFLAHVSTESIHTQVAILQSQQNLDRHNYSGLNDWLSYLQILNIELTERLSDEQMVTSNVGDAEEGRNLLASLKSQYIPLAQYGIPEIDYSDKELKTPGTPILRHRFVVIVGEINMGKSMFCIWQTARLLAEKRKVVYMFGESTRAKIYAQILLAYIWVRYHKSLLMMHMIDDSECTEEIIKIKTMAMQEVNDLLYLTESYSYDNLYNELVADYEKAKFDAVFIDHSYALTGISTKDNGKSSIDKMSIFLRSFKRTYPVYVCVASHPSTDARNAVSKDKTVGEFITKGSSNLAAEADETFILKDNEALRKQDQLMLENKKRRDAPVIKYPIILRKRFNCCSFEYDASLQHVDVIENAEAESALAELDRAYGENENLYELEAY